MGIVKTRLSPEYVVGRCQNCSVKFGKEIVPHIKVIKLDVPSDKYWQKNQEVKFKLCPKCSEFLTYEKLKDLLNKKRGSHEKQELQNKGNVRAEGNS